MGEEAPNLLVLSREYLGVLCFSVGLLLLFFLLLFSK